VPRRTERDLRVIAAPGPQPDDPRQGRGRPSPAIHAGFEATAAPNHGNGGVIGHVTRTRRVLGATMAGAMLAGLLLLPASAAAATRDTDGDGLTNAFEVNLSKTSPNRKDTDGDGLSDAREDPDHDGLTNLYEQLAATNPRKADSNGNGISDANEDPDHDGLNNRQEQVVGTNPRKADTDGDGIPDSREDPDHDTLWTITDFRAKVDPRKADTDGDGVRDDREDTDRDGLTNALEQRLGTNPGLADSDGDGTKDIDEDTDGDGLTNAVELARGLNPANPDTDGDGTPDGSEAAPAVPAIGPCQVLPADNVWNERIDQRPVASNSATMIKAIGATRTFHMDFGSYTGYGIPWQSATDATATSSVTFDYADESDGGPYPIPASPLIEGGSDRHLLVVNTDTCTLYELYDARTSGGAWYAGSGAMFDLDSNALRPLGWTSADAAGLPILPGLVRYEEVAAGEIDHALRFTAPVTRKAYIYPARHDASSSTSTSLPPMGLRVRLKASANLTGLSPAAKVIAVALQRYGMILADNGSPWYVSGMSNPAFDDDVLHELDRFTGADVEVVDTTGLVNGS
jgi:hypothetical protein